MSNKGREVAGRSIDSREISSKNVWEREYSSEWRDTGPSLEAISMENCGYMFLRGFLSLCSCNSDSVHQTDEVRIHWRRLNYSRNVIF